jgi:hypothetical protein
MASALGARAPAMVVDSRHLARQGLTLAPTSPHRRPSGASVRIDGCLGLLLAMTLIIACQ